MSDFRLPPEQFQFVKAGLKRLKLKSLQEYYESDAWARAKELRRTDHSEKCGVCEAPDRPGEHHSLHHKTYERLGRELGRDLSWLCQECHEQLHLLITFYQETGGMMSLALDYLKLEQKEERLSIENFQLTPQEKQAREDFADNNAEG